jgi:hypothetical protein
VAAEFSELDLPLDEPLGERQRPWR